MEEEPRLILGDSVGRTPESWDLAYCVFVTSRSVPLALGIPPEGLSEFRIALAGWSDRHCAESGNRRRRQRRPISQQTPQRQLEVALSQTVQIELWQQRSHLFCATREQRQDPALEALLQPTNTGSLDLYRATAVDNRRGFP